MLTYLKTVMSFGFKVKSKDGGISCPKKSNIHQKREPNLLHLVFQTEKGMIPQNTIIQDCMKMFPKKAM